MQSPGVRKIANRWCGLTSHIAIKWKFKLVWRCPEMATRRICLQVPEETFMSAKLKLVLKLLFALQLSSMCLLSLLNSMESTWNIGDVLDGNQEKKNIGKILPDQSQIILVRQDEKKEDVDIKQSENASTLWYSSGSSDWIKEEVENDGEKDVKEDEDDEGKKKDIKFVCVLELFKEKKKRNN
ncbi:hypothetical protein RFI_16926 [Reticulomyxa filosa]|uniref:Uncharacterized protein n=1 Tax=Reticulomyxa filosa TaxID=46433 RepID=X6N4P4_RETFI|nr:hypothetical protein RFI_16926 [Reticulomyxa filosa]|eukprot:ETO20292.1 hypothetical protein RFI_16926 [Reticulomyxa filosa]